MKKKKKENQEKVLFNIKLIGTGFCLTMFVLFYLSPSFFKYLDILSCRHISIIQRPFNMQHMVLAKVRITITVTFYFCFQVFKGLVHF